MAEILAAIRIITLFGSLAFTLTVTKNKTCLLSVLTYRLGQPKGRNER